MSVVNRIIESPADWSAAQAVDEVALHMDQEPDRRRDPSVPAWLRDVLVLCDFEPYVQMEGLLGWWEDRAQEDLQLVCAALTAVGLPDQAALLTQAEGVLATDDLSGGEAGEEWAVSSFSERQPDISADRLARFAEIEGRLWLNDAAAPELYSSLVGHAAAGLAQRSV